MVLRRIFLSLSLGILSAVAYAIDYVVNGLRYLTEPFEPRLATEGYVDFDATCSPVEPSILQALRHEAGVSRIAAARKQ